LRNMEENGKRGLPWDKMRDFKRVNLGGGKRRFGVEWA